MTIDPLARAAAPVVGPVREVGPLVLVAIVVDRIPAAAAGVMATIEGAAVAQDDRARLAADRAPAVVPDVHAATARIVAVVLRAADMG